MSTPQTAIDPKKLDVLMSQLVGDFGASASAVLVVLGDKLGLYKALQKEGALTSAELAARTGTVERYVREWLNANAASNYVSYGSSGNSGDPA